MFGSLFLEFVPIKPPFPHLIPIINPMPKSYSNIFFIYSFSRGKNQSEHNKQIKVMIICSSHDNLCILKKIQFIYIWNIGRDIFFYKFCKFWSSLILNKFSVGPWKSVWKTWEKDYVKPMTKTEQSWDIFDCKLWSMRPLSAVKTVGMKVRCLNIMDRVCCQNCRDERVRCQNRGWRG